MKSYILLVLLITIISFIGIGQSLNFALNGDDWQALYFYLTRFTDFQSHFDLKNFSTGVSNYTFAHIIMGLIYRAFSFNPFPYYLISMILRIIAAISFYPAIHAVTKDKLAVILSSVFFATMFAGIETTNWVFNMNTYISISLFNLFLYFYYSKDSSAFSKRNLLAASVLGLSFIITQNRMHGLLFVVPLFVLAKITNLNKKSVKETILKMVVFFIPISVYRFITRSSNDIGYTNYLIQAGGDLKNLTLSIFSSIGNVMLPEKIYTLFNITNELKAFFVFFIFSTLSLLILKKNFRSQKYFFTLICLSMSIFFLIIPQMVFGSSGTLSSDHRYLLIPGSYTLVAFAILLSDLLSYKNQFFKVSSVILIVIIVTINVAGLRNYFNNLSKNGRLVEDAEKQFTFILSQIEIPNNAPSVFLFIPDDPFYLYNSITFGLTYHLMLVDSRFSLDFQKSPFPVDNMESLIDVLSGPESKELKRYGYNPVQIPLENVYAFNLQNKNLTNITPYAREYLKEKLPHLK